MKFSVGEYVKVHRVEDAEGIDSDDMRSFLGHIGVVIEAVPEEGVAEEEQMYLVRFLGTGDYRGYFKAYVDGVEEMVPSGENCFTQMTFVGYCLRHIASPSKPITQAMFDEGGM